ncbi:hypothetical protein CCP4SC76_600013 [Gammaproteobacteria bacterium]
MNHREIEVEKSHWARFLSSRLDDAAFDLMQSIVVTDYGRNNENSGLELGCGEGRLVERIPNLVGIDYAMLGLRTRLQQHLPLVCADASFLPFERHSFDYAVTNSLHHMPFRETIPELVRVLRTGGVLHCFEPNRWHIYNLFFNQTGGKTIVGDRGFFPHELARTLNMAGFRDIQWRYIVLNMEYLKLLTRIQRIAQIIPSRYFQAWFYLRAVR